MPRHTESSRSHTTVDVHRQTRLSTPITVYSQPIMTLTSTCDCLLSTNNDIDITVYSQPMMTLTSTCDCLLSTNNDTDITVYSQPIMTLTSTCERTILVSPNPRNIPDRAPPYTAYFTPMSALSALAFTPIFPETVGYYTHQLEPHLNTCQKPVASYRHRWAL